MGYRDEHGRYIVDGRDHKVIGRPISPGDPLWTAERQETWDLYNAHEEAEAAVERKAEIKRLKAAYGPLVKHYLDRMHAGANDMAAERSMRAGSAPLVRFILTINGTIEPDKVEMWTQEIFDHAHAREISIHLDSGGGDYAAACYLHGVLRVTNAVVTVLGEASSAAVTVLLGAHRRRAIPGATFWLHSTEDEGLDPADEVERFNYALCAVPDKMNLQAFDSVRKRERRFGVDAAKAIGLLGHAPRRSVDEVKAFTEKRLVELGYGLPEKPKAAARPVVTDADGRCECREGYSCSCDHHMEEAVFVPPPTPEEIANRERWCAWVGDELTDADRDAIMRFGPTVDLVCLGNRTAIEQHAIEHWTAVREAEHAAHI